VNSLKLMRDIKSGEHLTYINYGTPKKLDYFGAFIAVGMERNEKCVYWFEDTSLNEIIDNLERYSIDVSGCIKSGKLVISPATEFYLENGMFFQKAVINKWLKLLEDAKNEGYTGVRLIGETGWIHDEKTFKDFLEYEENFNENLSGTDFTAICYYQVDKCTDEMIKWILHSHRYVFWDNGREVNLLKTPEILCSDGMVRFLHESIRDRVRLNQTLSNLSFINNLTSHMLCHKGLQNAAEYAIKYLACEYEVEAALLVIFDRDTKRTRSVCCYQLDCEKAGSMVEGLVEISLYEQALQMLPMIIDISEWECVLHDLWTQHNVRYIGIIPITNGRSIVGLTFLGWRFKHEAYGCNLELLSYLLDMINLTLDLYSLQEKTFEKKKEAEKLKALGVLAGGIAHEFNNILAVILGNCQLLELKLRDTDSTKFITEVATAAGDAAQIVRRIQNFSRPQAEHNRQNLQVNAVIASALEFTRTKWDNEAIINGLGIKVRTRLASQKWVCCNETELREVLINLILNSIDAMPNGGIISITSEDVQDKVIITVIDTGAGMTKTEMDMIFEPFFSTKFERGTGLGLSISDSIIKSYNGKIRVTSEKGKGSMFSIELPQVYDTYIDTHNETLPYVGSCNIWVVDDDEQVLNTLGNQLDSLGHKIVVYSNGIDLLNQINQGITADIIITDIGMPGINGVDLTKKIKQRNPELPVVLMTGWFEDTISLKNLQIADGVLYKPFTLYELQKQITRIKLAQAETA